MLESINLDPRDQDCEFCLEFQSKPGHTIWDLKEEITVPSLQGDLNRIFHRVNDAVIFPSLGPVVSGHALISPIHHHTSVLGLPGELFQDVAELLKQVSGIYSAIFGNFPLLFEHGEPVGRNLDSPNCIDHAHIHVVPEPVDLIGQIEKEYPHIASMPFTAVQGAYGKGYSMVIDEGEVAHLFDTTGAPRQYLRRVYASLVGRPENGSWTSNINLDDTFRDYLYLKKKFEDFLSLPNR